MRRIGLAALSICALCACGGSSGGGGSVAPPVDDAGTTADAGTVVTPPDDAGTAPDAGPADAGTADAGTGGGTTTPPADGGTVAGECEGIVPSSIGTPVTARFADSNVRTGCFNAASDESGNVIFGQSIGAWEIFSSTGTLIGAPRENYDAFFPQGSGFEGVSHNTVPANFERLAPDGSQQVVTPLDEAVRIVARGWPDGLLTVGQATADDCLIRRFADNGSLIASGSTGVPASNGCQPAAAAAAPNGVVLAVLFTSTDAQGRWFDAGMKPLTGFFHLTSVPPTDPDSSGTIISLRTLVNGDIAVQKDGVWIGILPANGGTTMKPAAAWMKEGHDFTIIRQGRAYAVADQDFASTDPDPETATLNTLDLVATTGKTCGTVTFPGAAVLTTGADGTVIGRSVAAGSCTRLWWTGLLK